MKAGPNKCISITNRVVSVIEVIHVRDDLSML